MEQPGSINEAVEAIKVAETLFQRYRHDVARLSSVSPDDYFLALDQNFGGIWEQLELARVKLAAAGREAADFDAVYQGMKEIRQGYDEERELKIGPTIGPGGIGLSIQERVTRSIDAQRLRSTGKAIAAIKAAVPEGVFGGRDADVEQFLAKQSHLRTALRLGAWVLGIGAVVTLALYGFSTLWSDDLETDDGAPLSKKMEGRIRVLEHKLKQGLCSRKREAVQLAETYIKVGAPERAIKRAREFFEKCGEHRRLRWATFTAHKRMADWDGATAEVSRLIEAVPHDWDYRWWRAQVHEQAGRLPAAVADYRQSVALNPGLSNIPFNLVKALERSGKPCEAILWLQTFAHHHPDSSAAIPQRIERLKQAGGCELSGRGTAELALGDKPCEEAEIRGKRAAKGCFAVFADGPFVLVSGKLAQQAGLQRGDPLLVRAPSGGLYKETSLAWAEKLTVLGASAEKVRVVVVDQAPEHAPQAAAGKVVGGGAGRGVPSRRRQTTERLPEGVDGLLGQAFLGRFVTNLAEDGTLSLSARAECGPDGAGGGQ
jgi:tetratricopeptide (TPR) repeat protein